MPANWKDTSMQDCVEDDTLSTDGHLASDTGSLNPWGKKKKKEKKVLCLCPLSSTKSHIIVYVYYEGYRDLM